MSKSLIIYFSITGNTKRVAQQMARKIGADPIWWGIPPRIIYTVIEALDLTDKKVASFATSGGSTYSDAQIEMDNLLKNPVKGRILSSKTSINSWLADNGLIS